MKSNEYNPSPKELVFKNRSLGIPGLLLHIFYWCKTFPFLYTLRGLEKITKEQEFLFVASIMFSALYLVYIIFVILNDEGEEAERFHDIEDGMERKKCMDFFRIDQKLTKSLFKYYI